MFKLALLLLFQTLTFNHKEYCVKTPHGFECGRIEKQKTEFFLSEELLEEHINGKYNETLFLKEMTQTISEGDSVISFTATSKPISEFGEEYFIVNITKTGDKLQIFRYYWGSEERWTFTK